MQMKWIRLLALLLRLLFLIIRLIKIFAKPADDLCSTSRKMHIFEENDQMNPFRSKCPIRGTFFVKHDYNNYAMIEELYYRGNEIAVNSVTGRNLQYENASIWKEEIEGQRNLLGELANIPAKDILGVRAESLKPGFNKQFEVSSFSSFWWRNTFRKVSWIRLGY